MPIKKRYQKDIEIRDLKVRVTFDVEGEDKERSPLDDDELKGKLVDVHA